jgi:hypothetical protein
LRLSKNAGGIQCVFFFLVAKTFPRKKNHEKFMVWIVLRPFFKTKINTTRCHQLQEASESMILSIKINCQSMLNLLGMLVSGLQNFDQKNPHCA